MKKHLPLSFLNLDKVSSLPIIVRIFIMIGVFFIADFVLMRLGLDVFIYLTSPLFSQLISHDATGFFWTAYLYCIYSGVWIMALLLAAVSNTMKRLLPYQKKGGNTFRRLCIGVILGFALNTLCIICAMLHGDISIYYAQFQPLAILILFVMMMIQSSAEELVYRGFVYQASAKCFPGTAIPIVVNSLACALIYRKNPGINIYAYIMIFLVGIVHSLFIYYFDSLWLAVGAHTAWSYTQTILFGLPNSGVSNTCSVFQAQVVSQDTFFYSPDFGIEAAPFTILVYVIVIVILVWKFHKKRLN